MCGILGGMSVAPLDVCDDEPRLSRCIDSLAHRGPDERGAFVHDRRAFLGHRRLGIVDLAGGQQPIVDESGRVHLIYNGEIYNHRGLRDELLSRGHVFRSRTDGEAALHLYQERPRDFERRLAGMFAIAILDRDAGRLTLVRDRLGIKPLYYYADGKTLLFASELKAILLLLDQRPAISRRGLHAYLRCKYVPAPDTIYEGIRELPPGCRLTATIAGGAARASHGAGLEIDVQRYWEVPRGAGRCADEASALEELEARLRASVEGHLEADVEVGALLSGGVDSSLVVALAARLAPGRLKTFSVGFRELGFDQLPEAARLARHCGTDHREIYVELDPVNTLPRLVRCFDQPFADSSALACYAVCQVAAEHVKVALTGDGGDEGFAGYRRYQDVMIAARRDAAWRRTAQRVVFSAGAALFSPEAKFLRRARAAAYRPLRAHVERELLCGDWLRRRLLGEAYRADGDPREGGPVCLTDASEAEGLRDGSLLERVQYDDLTHYLPGDILAKVDRTSMAWSLECRVPLLDHAVVEFAATLHDDLRIRNGQGKYLLKRMAERYVPHDLIYRKKRGFRVPIRRWFKRSLLDEAAGMLRGGVLVERGVLDARGIEWALRNQRRAWMNLSSCLWALLFLEQWAREYL
jgi:asparagine synthase (glutamine-hydrolysing)